MSISEYMTELKALIRSLIDDVREIKNEIEELRNDVGILKIEIRKLEESNKGKEKKIDKKIIEKDMSRIGKKHIESKKIVIESGSYDDEFRKKILPKILEEEEIERLKEISLEKLKIKEDQEEEQQDE